MTAVYIFVTLPIGIIWEKRKQPPKRGDTKCVRVRVRARACAWKRWVVVLKDAVRFGFRTRIIYRFIWLSHPRSITTHYTNNRYQQQALAFKHLALKHLALALALALFNLLSGLSVVTWPACCNRWLLLQLPPPNHTHEYQS